MFRNKFVWKFNESSLLLHLLPILRYRIWMGYAGYIVFRSLYQMMITVASFEVARRISETSYGLVFGFNTFVALGLQTILTTIVASSAGLALSPPAQFQVYGGCFLVMGLVFILSGGLTMARGGLADLRREGIWRSDDKLISETG